MSYVNEAWRTVVWRCEYVTSHCEWVMSHRHATHEIVLSHHHITRKWAMSNREWVTSDLEWVTSPMNESHHVVYESCHIMCEMRHISHGWLLSHIIQGDKDAYDVLSLYVISRKRALWLVALLWKDTCNMNASCRIVRINHLTTWISHVWQWFGDTAKKAALGHFKAVMSSDGFQVQMSHGVMSRMNKSYHTWSNHVQ